MKKRILLFLCCLLVMVTLVGCSGNSEAEKTAKTFFEHFKEKSFYNMGRMSKYDLNELSEKFVGINIIDYSIKSTDEHKAKHTIEIHNDGDNEQFDNDKIRYGTGYPDYEIIVDNESDWIIQSKEENISESTIIFDVEYSDLVGDTWQNTVTLTVTQRFPNSEDFIITEVAGINNLYSDI